MCDEALTLCQPSGREVVPALRMSVARLPCSTGALTGWVGSAVVDGESACGSALCRAGVGSTGGEGAAADESRCSTTGTGEVEMACVRGVAIRSLGAAFRSADSE